MNTTSEASRAAGVVLAAGRGGRYGADGNKAYLPLAGRALASWALAALAAVPEVRPLVLVIRPEDHQHARWVTERELPEYAIEVVTGGATRHESEHHALRHLASRIDTGALDTVLLHDAARPLVPVSLVAGVLHAARAHGAAVPAVPAEDLVTVDEAGHVVERTPGRLVRVQTPQAFAAAPLLEAYERAARAGFVGTDTASCVERFGSPGVRWIMGDPRNLKVTYPEDLIIAERLLTESGFQMT